MIKAHQKPSPEVAEKNRQLFYQRFEELKKGNDIDKPYLSYTPSWEYQGIGLVETRYQ